MKDQRKLQEQFEMLSSQIREEDDRENKELAESFKMEEEGNSDSERENQEMFKELGLKDASKAIKKANDNARKKTDRLVKVKQNELVKEPDHHLDDARFISQAQAIAAVPGQATQGSLYSASMSKFDLGETDSSTKLELGSQNIWCKAWGGGWYGAGSIAINADFWHLHYPPTYKYLHIHPYVILHGFYRNIADDKWYNSAYSRTRVQVQIRSYQYFWSGWTSSTVHNLGDDNINRYGRIDRLGHFAHHMNVGAGDPVWALTRVRIYAYARAGGSYSEVNFSDGAGNYVDVGHVDFF